MRGVTLEGEAFDFAKTATGFIDSRDFVFLEVNKDTGYPGKKKSKQSLELGS
jgi:hypothetical protein